MVVFYFFYFLSSAILTSLDNFLCAKGVPKKKKIYLVIQLNFILSVFTFDGTLWVKGKVRMQGVMDKAWCFLFHCPGFAQIAVG